MPRLEVLRMGHPDLRKRSEELREDEIASVEIQTLIQDLIETMHAEQGVGIAAPQVGVLKRLCVIEFKADNARYPGMSKQNLTVFINPVLEILDTNPKEYWEGCLSVPGLRGLVKRPSRVKVKFLDQQAQQHEWIADGFLAIVLQHEFDHLDGVLYVDRVSDNRNLAFVDEFRQFILPQQNVQSLESEDH